MHASNESRMTIQNSPESRANVSTFFCSRPSSLSHTRLPRAMRVPATVSAPLRQATARATPRAVPAVLVPGASPASSSSPTFKPSLISSPSTPRTASFAATGTTSTTGLGGARAFGSSVIPHAVRDYASAFLHGSEELKEEARVQHSRAVGRDVSRTFVS